LRVLRYQYVARYPEDFLTDSDSEPAAFNHDASRHLLQLEHARAPTGSEAEWDSLLGRAIERGRDNSYEAALRRLEDDSRHLPPPVIWRVAVKVGWPPHMRYNTRY